MPPADPVLFEEDDVTQLSSFSFGVVPAGTASDPVPFHLWNANGNPSADTASGLALVVHEADPGMGNWNQRGRPTAERWVEFRLLDVIGDALPQVTPWTPAGVGRPFLVNPIPPDSARVGEFRLVVPAGTAALDRDYSISVDYARPAVPLGLGLEESGLRGVRSGVGDSLSTHLVEGGAVTPSDPADAEVHVADVSWIHQGIPHQLLAGDIATDGDAADGALADGEAYWIALSLGAGAAVTVTKGNKGTAPLDTELRPDLPGGELLLGYVHREEAGEIEAGDIFQDGLVYGRMVLYGAGLERWVGHGEAVADNFLVRWDTPRPVSLPADTADVWVWLIPQAGLLSVQEDATRPADRALPIWRGATDGADITVSQDLRRLLGHRLEVLRFPFPEVLDVGQEVHAVVAAEVPAYLRLPAPVRAALRAQGTATAGRTCWEVERWDGAAWASLFPSSGTVDRRPAFAFDATELASSAARPEVLLIEPATRLRARVVEVPSGGTAPSGGELVLTLEVTSHV